MRQQTHNGRSPAYWIFIGFAAMAEVRFWLLDWEAQCCGERRKVGDTITARLSGEGTVELSNEMLLTESLRDGSMSLVGDVSDLGGPQPAWLIDTGVISVAWPRKCHGKRVWFRGKLMEGRHSDIGAEVSGTITGMRWHRAIYEDDRETPRCIGYEDPVVISSTDKYPGNHLPIKPGIVQMKEAARKSERVGPPSVEAAPTDDWERSRWAFEFILEV
jgi:hypothetical protein